MLVVKAQRSACVEKSLGALGERARGEVLTLPVVALPHSGVALDGEVAVVLDDDEAAVLKRLGLHRNRELEQVVVVGDRCDEVVLRNESHIRNGTTACVRYRTPRTRTCPRSPRPSGLRPSLRRAGRG